jgi:hypothetical protein
MFAHLRLKLPQIALALSLVSVFPLAAQTPATPAAESFTLPTAQSCSNQLSGAKPRIYIANFLVTYGKKTMGRLIADNIAFRFENDERFELIPRKTIDKEMSSLFKKKLKPEEYLNLAVSLAAEHQADCVIFGKIGKKGSQISFLVRMASVATGENKIKVDEDVERKEASAFFERTGESLVAYFSAAPPAAVVVAPPASVRPKAILTAWGGYSFVSLSSTDQSIYDSLKSVSGSTSNLGGISGGADLWFPVSKAVDIGLGAGYLSIYAFSYSGNLSGDTVKIDLNTQYVPVMAQLRFISEAGLFAGFGFGYYTSISNQTWVQNGVNLSLSGSASAFGINGNLGWQISLGSGAALTLGSKFWYIFESGAPQVITPYAGFSIKF